MSAATKDAVERCLPALAKSTLVGHFGPEEWRRLAAYLEIASFPEGERVIEESAEGQEMYFVIEGEGRLRRAHVDLGEIGPGDHFGELALIGRRQRAASVVAKTHLVLARLSRPRYDAMVAEQPALALRFLQALVSSLGVRLTEMTDSVGLLLRERSLPRRVTVEVRIAGVARRVKTGTPVSALLPSEDGGAQVVAALLAHKAVSLDTPVTSDTDVAPLTMDHWEGRRVYRMSLGLLLLEAARRVDPEASVSMGPSMGFAQRVIRTGPAGLDPAAWVERVRRMMGVLIGIDAAFRHELWTVEEARSHFLEQGWSEAGMLLRSWRSASVPL